MPTYIRRTLVVGAVVAAILACSRDGQAATGSQSVQARPESGQLYREAAAALLDSES